MPGPDATPPALLVPLRQVSCRRCRAVGHPGGVIGLFPRDAPAGFAAGYHCPACRRYHVETWDGRPARLMTRALARVGE